MNNKNKSLRIWLISTIKRVEEKLKDTKIQLNS